MGKGFGVVVIAFFAVLQHVLQMRDQFSIRTCWNRGLMHVEGTGKG